MFGALRLLLCRKAVTVTERSFFQGPRPAPSLRGVIVALELGTASSRAANVGDELALGTRLHGHRCIHARCLFASSPAQRPRSRFRLAGLLPPPRCPCA